MKILVETSARHIHLSRSDFEVLFGRGAELAVQKELSQPGEFVSTARLEVVGPKNKFAKVAVLGPLRAQTQVEISLTDSINLGLSVPVRDSGNLEGTPGCMLVGPNGKLEIPHGVIIAKRHIHMDPHSAEAHNLSDGQTVRVAVQTEHRSLTFENVIVRVSKNFAPAMHIDTDETNAAGIIAGPTYGEVLI